jgi:hypothetical protein
MRPASARELAGPQPFLLIRRRGGAARGRGAGDRLDVHGASDHGAGAYGTPRTCTITTRTGSRSPSETAPAAASWLQGWRDAPVARPALGLETLGAGLRRDLEPLAHNERDRAERLRDLREIPSCRRSSCRVASM